MTTVFLDAVLKSFFFLNRPWHGPTTDDRWNEFPDGWLPSNHSTYGVCERKHAISNTPHPKEKNHTFEDRESEGATARLRNGKWGARETCFEQWSLTRFAVCAVVPSCWNHTLAQFILLRRSPPPPWPTYWVVPIRKMWGSRGSLCIRLV